MATIYLFLIVAVFSILAITEILISYQKRRIKKDLVEKVDRSGPQDRRDHN